MLAKLAENYEMLVALLSRTAAAAAAAAAKKSISANELVNEFMFVHQRHQGREKEVISGSERDRSCWPKT